MRTNSSKVLIVVSVALILTCLFPLSVFAQSGKYYLTLKPGAYFPRSHVVKDVDLDFDPGFNGEIAIGRQFSKNFAVEMGVGYFHTGASSNLLTGTLDDTGGFVVGSVDVDIDVVPVTLSLKGILPVGKWEFFGFGGIGAYFLWADAKGSDVEGGTTTRQTFKDNDVIFGGHLGLGLHYNITPRIFVGAEGRYLWASEAKVQDRVLGELLQAKLRMSGAIATAVFGFRF